MASDTLKAPDTLWRVGSLQSKSGKVSLQLQDDHNLVLYDNGKAVWSAGTAGTFVVKGIMMDDGNFVLFEDNGRPAWSTKTNGWGDKSSFLRVADEGNWFVFSGGEEIFRAMKQSVRPPPVQPPPPQPVKPANVEYAAAVPTSTLTALRGGQSLALKQSISSPNAKVSLTLQEDGNLCAFFKEAGDTRLLWESRTANQGVATMKLRATGELVLLKADKSRVWSSDAQKTGEAKDSVLLVQDDGHAVILSNATRVWRTLCPKLSTTEPDRLSADEYFEVKQKLVSPNGKSKLVLQPDNNLCLYTDGVEGAVWALSTDRFDDTIPRRVVMRGDDDLWYGDPAEWTSNTRRRKGPGDGYLLLRDDAVIMIKSDGLTIWSSDEKKAPLDKWEPLTTPVIRPNNKLKAGEHIPIDSSINSKNGQFQAWLTESGNFTVFRRVGAGEWQFLWSSKTSALNESVSKVSLSWAGSLVVYSGNQKKLWEQRDAESAGSTELTMQDDGNLVLARNSNVMWSTETNFPATVKRVDRLRPGEWLAIDQSLTSANGQYTLIFQANANFIITKKSDSSKLTANSARNVTGAQLMCLDRESNDLCIYNKDGKMTQRAGKVLWRTGNTDTLGRDETEFIMQDDGNAVFRIRNKVIWTAKDNPTMGTVPPLDLTKPPPRGMGDEPTGGEGTNFIRGLMTLRTRQELISDNNRTFVFQMDNKGMLSITSNKRQQATVIWKDGPTDATDDPQDKFLRITNLGELQVRGPRQGAADSKKMETLWKGGTLLGNDMKFTDCYLMIESDGTPTIYNGKEVMWRPPNWKRAP